MEERENDENRKKNNLKIKIKNRKNEKKEKLLFSRCVGGMNKKIRI